MDIVTEQQPSVNAEQPGLLTCSICQHKAGADEIDSEQVPTRWEPLTFTRCRDKEACSGRFHFGAPRDYWRNQLRPKLGSFRRGW